jgi:ATP-binding cassette subfamily B protein
MATMGALKRVFGYCRRYPGYALATLACAITSTLAAMVPPWLTGFTIDEVLGNTRPEWLAIAALGVVVAFFLRDFLNSLRIQFNNIFEQDVVYDLRHDLYEKMQRLPVRWFDKQASGDLVTRFSEDVTSMERVLIDGIEQGTVSILQISLVSVFLFFMNAELALIALTPLPLLGLGAWLYTRTAHQRYRIIRKATSAMNSLLLDNLQGIRQIKAFARESEELDHVGNQAHEVRKGTLIVMRAWARYSPGMSFLGACGYVLVLYFGGRLVLDPATSFSIGELASFLFYIGLLYEPVNRLHQLNQLIQAGRAAAERVFDIMDSPEDYEPEHPIALPARSGTGRRVRFDHVSFSYDADISVLNDIHLSVDAGKSLALVGPTGAGKSTIINLLTRFYLPTHGRIEVDGIDLLSLSTHDLRREIAYVTQEPFLFDRTVRENLLVAAPAATQSDCVRALEQANAWDFVSRLPEKLDTELGERGVRLSVGEKQRITIARALLQDAPILILDEATASVDTQTEKLIQDALEKLMDKRTTFMIAHRLSTVRRADSIAVIEGGQITEWGNHAELIERHGLYARLCSIQDDQHTIEETLASLQ